MLIHAYRMNVRLNVVFKNNQQIKRMHKLEGQENMSSILPMDLKDMANYMPCSLLQLALDDELTIVSANDEFYRLIDYNQSDVLPKSVFRMVYSADIIYFTHQVTQQKERKDSQLMVFFRVLQKSGSLKWIMINGNKTEENILIRDKTVPIYFCTAADMTTHMTVYKRLEQETEYHRIILELSRELFFEYIIASDTLFFSELFREIFNKEAVIKNFSKKLEKSKIIHPDDLPYAVNIFKSVMNGKKQVKFEFRLRTKEDKIAWYICYASIIYDENKNPYKVVGKLAFTNKLEDNTETDANMEYDTVTGVYTKDTAQRLISNSLSLQSPNSLSALLLCEVQNYQGANELARMINGENVLAKISSIFKNLFRKTDVIGRTGLGNFVIYMKDLGSEKAAYEAAEQICREVDKLYSYEFNKNKVSVSIGVTLINGKTDYITALTNAQKALVMAENNCGSSFDVYYPVNNSQ